MAVNTRRQVFAQSKVFAIVDQDAFEDLAHKPKFRQLYEANQNIIYGMGYTPEVYLIEQFESSNHALKEKIRRRFHIECTQIIACDEYQACNAQNPRKLAKDRYDIVITHLCEASGDSIDIVNDELICLIIEQMPCGDIRHLWGPIIGH